MTQRKRVLALIGLLTFAFIIPAIAIAVSKLFFTLWSLDNESLHSSVEAIGAFTALVLATMLLLQHRYGGSSRYLWVSSSMFATGLLDILHAVQRPGQDFVFLRLMAAFMGSVLISLVWLPGKPLPKKLSEALPVAAAFISAVIGAVILISPAFPEVMDEAGVFTPFANFLSMASGALYLVASIRFIMLFYRSGENENFFFAIISLLFSIAAFFFPYSRVWNADWWLWHIFRLSGYIIVLIFVFLSFDQAQKNLLAAKSGLEERVRQRTRELEDSRIEAEAANKAKSEFLANVSHEFRNPLNSITGFCEILSTGLAGKLTDEQLKYIEEIRLSGNQLLKLISEILDLSRLETGEAALELGHIDVAEMISTSMAIFRVRAASHGITLALNNEAGAAALFADEKKLKQVIYNLVDNALKFTPEGGSVRIDLRLTRSDEKDYMEFSVSDTGIGIAEKDFDRLFKPFQQLEPTLTKRHPGAGLGLSICKKLVELHGGRIYVESRVSEGSRFYFIIPLDIKPR